MKCQYCKYYISDKCTYNSDDWLIPCDEHYDENPFDNPKTAIINLDKLTDEIAYYENLAISSEIGALRAYANGFLNALNVVLETMLIRKDD